MLRILKTKRLIIVFIAVFISIAGVAYFYGKSKAAKPPQEYTINPAFSAYITSYTSGVVSSGSTIKIRFAEIMEDSSGWGKETSSYISLSPSVKGKSFWIDATTLEFRPDKRLEPGKFYEATLSLSKLMDVPDQLKDFKFRFQVIAQNFDVLIKNLTVYDVNDLTRQKLEGSFVTADIAEPKDVETALKAFQDGKPLEINWTHLPDSKSHEFVVENITRKEESSLIGLKWDGAPLMSDKKGEETIDVPALGDFKLTNVRVVQSPDQYLLLQFSDPLQENQNLSGLISIGNLSDLKYYIKNNEISIYPPVRQTGSKTIHIYEGVKNILGYALKQEITATAVFEQIKPAVRMVGKGVILPSTEGLIMPFEAVNLKAVEVSVVKIYENNVAQFLQVNELSGNQEMTRVGRPVIKKTIQLTSGGVTDLARWNRFTLDLSEIIKTEPGAIYQVKLGFKKQHLAYFCEGDEQQVETGMVEMNAGDGNWDDAAQETTAWDNYEDYYYNDDYNWNERDNPCNSSYYGDYRSVKRNILASDFGLIAKRGGDGNLQVFVTNLINTQPLANVNIEIFNYQQQVIQSGMTDNEGKLIIRLDQKPFILVASQNEQRGYLKLNDGVSLPLSTFNVQGAVVQKGIKGFLYGERGVWRPGDTLHLSFILEDKNKLIPATHPVILELFNPQGQLEKKIVKNESVGGFYNFSVNTKEDSPTGDWLAKVSVGGAAFNKSLKIETIKPNRLKINIDFGVDKLVDGDIKGNLEVKWLHGAIAKNLKAEFDVILTQSTTKFEGYQDFIFDDPAREYYSESQKIFDGAVDDQGKAIIQTKINVESSAPGMLMANFKGKVFEESGDFSVDRFSIPYYPYKSFVGVRVPKGDFRGMLLTDTLHTINIVTVDANGKPVSKNGVEVEIMKLDWRWWWDNSQSNIANYVSSRHNSAIASGKINTTNGKGAWKFKINYPEWGRFLVRVCDPESGHCTGKVVYIDWPGWAGRAQRDIPGGATMLSFSANKEKYEVGEEVRINIPSSNQGRALVSIENGSKVVASYWVETQKGETPFMFSTTKEMTPNVFVNVTLLQHHNQTVNDLPIRLYGIVPILVEDPQTILKPQIAMAETLRPGSPVIMKISEANGRAMAYTIAVVDDGLLDLTRFKTPDPWSSFYAREALGVKTWDLYDDVMGAFGGQLERLLAVGGDDEMSDPENTKANRFKPVVTYMGPFYLKDGKTAEHTFTMPQYIGSVRTMVIAGNQGAYGFAEKTTPVKQELMVLGTLPRVLGPEETVKLPVNIFSADAKIKQVKIEIKANQLFTIQGASTKTITFSGEGDQLVEFDLKMKPALGVGKIKILASSGSFNAENEIEIEVRNPNPAVVDVKDVIIEPGRKQEFTYVPVGMAGTNSGILEVSNIPPVNLGKRLKFLLNYPHGCVEQTTSAVFAQLFISNIKELQSGEAKKIDDNVRAGIERLKKFQTADGGLAYWPGDRDANPWGTNYAGHFLLEADAKGYHVPSSLINGWVKYQKQEANRWRKNSNYNRDDLIQAYRLYTLALAKKPELGAMNRLREIKDLSVQARWQLAAAYALAGQKDAANDIVKNSSFTIQEYRELSQSFGTPLRDKAMILETLTLLNQRDRGIELMKEICAGLSDNQSWMSTQTTAYCLIAVSRFAGKADKTSDLQFAYQINSEKLINTSTELPLSQVKFDIQAANSGKVLIENKTKGVVFARLILEGIPSKGDTSSAENSLMMDIVYKDMDGNLLNPSNLPQGTDFMAEVTFANPGLRGVYQEMALTQIFPSGWEIHNTRMDGSESFYQKDKPNYQDIRDDRVFTYFDLRPNQRKTFRVLLNATYAGEYYLPTIYCEAMYDHSINARKPGQWVKVVKEQEM